MSGETGLAGLIGFFLAFEFESQLLFYVSQQKYKTRLKPNLTYFVPSSETYPQPLGPKAPVRIYVIDANFPVIRKRVLQSVQEGPRSELFLVTYTVKSPLNSHLFFYFQEMVPVEVKRPKSKAMSQKKKPHQKRMWIKQVILINFLEKAQKRKSHPIS